MNFKVVFIYKMLGTAVIIEPRKLVETEYVILNCYSYLYRDFKIVFYCGKSHYEYYCNLFKAIAEVRTLDCDNFTPEEYSDFMKRKEFWESLEGDWVLVFQSDSWILDNPRFDINYFVKKDYSYIGGNMSYDWKEMELLPKEKTPILKAFNGGLSLRKKRDMIQIIDTYKPEKTIVRYNSIGSTAEDVYFSLGCILLDKKVGDDVDSVYFCMHTIYVDNPFGLHSPSHDVKLKIKDKLPYIYAKI